MNYIYQGFFYRTLEDAEEARRKDFDGWEDGRRKCIWNVEEERAH